MLGCLSGLPGPLGQGWPSGVRAVPAPPFGPLHPGVPRDPPPVGPELAGSRVAVEFRHRDWSRHPEVFDLLAAERAIYVIVDLPDLPWLMPTVEEVTAEWAVIRFHGRNREGWAKAGATTEERYDYDYGEDELRRWVNVIERLSRRVDRLFAMFNNHVRGNMARNAQVLLNLLGSAARDPVT